MNKNTLAKVLNEALMDEYNARDTYRKVINKFGPVRPFINIVESEQAHIEMLLPLYEKYNISVPPEPDLDRILIHSDLLKACEDGVAGEIENIAMYERLINATDFPDVLEVLQCLQAASRDNHLPAFERCVERESMPRNGRGLGRRCGNSFKH